MPTVSRQDAERWLSRLQLNSYELGTGTRAFGAITFSTMSTFNHACEPNVDVAPLDAFQYLAARRSIAVGEELVVSYIPQGQSLAHRSKALMDSFGFVCLCGLCLREGLKGGNKARKKANSKATRAARVLRENDAKVAELKKRREDRAARQMSAQQDQAPPASTDAPAAPT